MCSEIQCSGVVEGHDLVLFVVSAPRLSLSSFPSPLSKSFTSVLIDQLHARSGLDLGTGNCVVRR